MKKLILATLALAFLFSLTSNRPAEEAITIHVTSDSPAKFNLVKIVGVEDVAKFTGLTTPYQLELEASDAKFLFKADDPESPINIEAYYRKTAVTASWPITVVLARNGTLETFGTD